MSPNGTTSFPYISSACREMFDIKPEEVQQDGRLLTEAVHSEDKKIFFESIAISAQTLQSWDWEGRIIARSGEIKWIRGISRPQLQTDGAIVWDGLLIDISEKQAVINELQQTKLELEQAKAELETRVDERTLHLQQQIYEHQKTHVELVESKQFINSIIDIMPVA